MRYASVIHSRSVTGRCRQHIHRRDRSATDPAGPVHDAPAEGSAFVGRRALSLSGSRGRRAHIRPNAAAERRNRRSHTATMVSRQQGVPVLRITGPIASPMQSPPVIARSPSTRAACGESRLNAAIGPLVQIGRKEGGSHARKLRSSRQNRPLVLRQAEGVVPGFGRGRRRGPAPPMRSRSGSRSSRRG